MTNDVTRLTLRKCGKCGGKGIKDGDICPVCDGDRYVPEEPTPAAPANPDKHTCIQCGKEYTKPDDWGDDPFLCSFCIFKAHPSELATVKGELATAREQLRELSENNADIFRQMEAEAQRADEAESALASARNEVVRLKTDKANFIRHLRDTIVELSANANSLYWIALEDFDKGYRDGTSALAARLESIINEEEKP